MGLLLICLGTILGLRMAPEPQAAVRISAYFKENALAFSASTLALKKSISQLDENKNSLLQAKEALKNCRLQYKKIEFLMDYFFQSSALIYNRPAKTEVEEPYMEYQEPSGFQVIEALLFEDHPLQHLQDLKAQAELLSSSAADLAALMYQFEASDAQLLESLRLELIKVMALSITGYDAPELKSGIAESLTSLKAIQFMLEPYVKEKKVAVPLLSLQQSIDYLSLNQNFDEFNRMVFLKDYALPLQGELYALSAAIGPVLSVKTALNEQTGNLFAKNAILLDHFPQETYPAEKEARLAGLGKKLFFEKSLSGNLSRSCASCHQPEQYFSDGLKTSLAFDGKSHVKRNAPTLLYSAYQYVQFWDGRAGNLSSQIKMVMANPLEMNADHRLVVERLEKNKYYQQEFEHIFQKGSGPSIDHVAQAIAAYLKTLSPFNSAFDRYITEKKNTMTSKQIRGFNLFMGKAQCGSCHFIPLFNGLIPPYYKRTEFEVLGVPANDNFNRPLADTDKGRYDFFPISYYQGTFKTPGLRNVAMTGPYMHNGAIANLQKVMDFYNRGGGNGIGLQLGNQSLSSKPLHLTKKERNEIIDFMKSLTDGLPE